MKSVTFSKTVTGGDGETLKEGGTFSLNDASADRWIKRGVASMAETKRNIVGHSAPAHEDKRPKADDPKEVEPEKEPKAEAHTRAEPKAHEAAKKK